jgi:hypothetical protein
MRGESVVGRVSKLVVGPDILLDSLTAVDKVSGGYLRCGYKQKSRFCDASVENVLTYLLPLRSLSCKRRDHVSKMILSACVEGHCVVLACGRSCDRRTTRNATTAITHVNDSIFDHIYIQLLADYSEMS